MGENSRAAPTQRRNFSDIIQYHTKMNGITQPQLVILQHESIGEMNHAKNGVQKSVHVVVKNTPFHITLGFNNPSKDTNFIYLTAEALLMYDCEEDRFVDFVRDKPLEYKGTMSPAGDTMKFEIRLKKLSSQLEDMFFKIRFRCVDTNTKQEVPSLEVTSLPIKVVSKPEQAARIIGGEKKGTEKKAPRAKKRTHNEMMYETIQRMEKQQQEQHNMLQAILTQQAPGPFSSAVVPPSKKENDSVVTIEQAICNLVSAFDAVPAAERPLKMRRIAEVLPTTTTTTLREISGHLQANAETLQRSSWTNATSAVPFTQPIDVSSDLLTVDEDFYTDFLSSF